MADQWIDGFKQNMVCYDNQAKEVVRITNGKCVLDHSSQQGFKEAHEANAAKTGQCGCLYAPSEAAAIRCIGVTEKGEPIVAFTYRRVDAQHLRPAKDMEFPDMSKVHRSLFIGRV